MKKVLLTTGGTGGHIFPAIAVGEELHKQHGCEILFAGSKLSTNPFFDQSLPYEEIATVPFAKHPWKFLKAISALIQGVLKAKKTIREFNPDAVIGFGSYHTLPILIASKLLRKPIFLHEANSVPGKVNRLFAPFVEKTWVHFPETQTKIRGDSSYGGMPLRSNFKKGILSKEEARNFFGLNPELVTFLIFGGSQGAKRVNELCLDAMILLKKEFQNFQVVHFTGDQETAIKIKASYSNAGISSYVKSFEKKMEVAWSAADFVITRAGAGTVAEQFEFEVPGVLIPFPFATDFHQDKNADFIVGLGLGVKLPEKTLTGEKLARSLLEFMKEGRNETRFAKTRALKKIKISNELIAWLGNR